MISVWLQVLCKEKARYQGILSCALAAFGINTTTDVFVGPGLVFFDELTEEVEELIHEQSKGGEQCVVGLAESRTLLKGSAGWRLLKLGAADVLAWDCNDPARAAASRIQRFQEVDEVLASGAVAAYTAGSSRAWKTLLHRVAEVAAFSDSSILLIGESGTGKERLAHLIHELDRRPNKGDLVTLDCTTVVPELSGSEFFGHERGAFTGAISSRDGAFALAHDGTLFLDEVGELPQSLQAQLLRVIQEKAFKRVGGNTWQRSNFRLISATNRELPTEIERGTFRNDFYHRIATWVFHLPPLRERREDILPLSRRFLQELRPNEPAIVFDEAVCDYLLFRDYPGNVRQLKQVICQIANRHVGPGSVTLGDIPESERPDGSLDDNWAGPAFEEAISSAISRGVGLKELSRTATETAIRLTLSAEEGNLQRAARRLGVTDRTLQLRRANKGEC